MKPARLIAMTIVATLVVALFSSLVPADRADAADGSLFNPGMIISDALFFDGGAMTAVEVQSFLNAQVPNCVAGATCLKNFTQTTQSRAATPGRCAAYAGAPNESAATIIARVGAACNISQKAILVLLQKEQGLVTATNPSEVKFRIATGYGCPDTAECNSEYYGFYNQVYKAAWQFQVYANNPGFGGHVAGRVNNIRFHPDASCGTSPVFIQNQATAGLYNYTPYQPNKAALNNLYGIGDSCSSYGNRNFWRLYTDWFGPTGTSSLVSTQQDATVYLISGGIKYPIPSYDIFTSLAPLGPLAYVSQSYLDGLPRGHSVGHAIRGPDNTIYFFDSGKRLPFPSCEIAVDYGASCNPDDFVQLTSEQINLFQAGPVLGSVLGTAEGGRYFISKGTKSEILDEQSQQAAGLPAVSAVLTESAISYLSLVKPIVRDSVFVRQRNTGSFHFLSAGHRYPIRSTELAEFGTVSRVAGSLNTASLSLIPADLGIFTGVLSPSPDDGVSILASNSQYKLAASTMTSSIKSIPAAKELIDSYPVKGTIGPGSMIDGPNDVTVYIVMDTDIRPIGSWDALLGLTGGQQPVITRVPSEVISAMPRGVVALIAGALYRTNDNATVYLINGVTNRLAFSSFAFPLAAGFTRFEYTTNERLYAYPMGPTLLTHGVTCDGNKYVTAGNAGHLVSPDKLGLFPFDFVDLDQFTCKALRIGAPAPDYIRSPDGSIYQLDGGKKRPITSWARFMELNPSGTFLQVDGTFVALIPTGAVA